MSNQAHVKSIVIAAGGNTKIAEAANLTPPAVSDWIARGFIPIERVPLIERLSGIPRHLIRPDRPDIYPPPNRNRRRVTA